MHGVVTSVSGRWDNTLTKCSCRPTRISTGSPYTTVAVKTYTHYCMTREPAQFNYNMPRMSHFRWQRYWWSRSTLRALQDHRKQFFRFRLQTLLQIKSAILSSVFLEDKNTQQSPQEAPSSSVSSSNSVSCEERRDENASHCTDKNRLTYCWVYVTWCVTRRRCRCASLVQRDVENHQS